MCKKILYSMCKVIPASATGFLNDAVSVAVQMISQGCVVGVPTDTVYGLACNAQDSLAVSRLYAIKGRKQDNPISICVGKVSHIEQWADVQHIDSGLLSALLPGPVTLVLNRSAKLNPLLNPETSKVGVRIPESKFMQELAEMCDFPLALTSANTSGHSASLEAQEFRHLWPLLEAVFDGGKLGKMADQRKGSTVVDLGTKGRFQVLRWGIAYGRIVRLLESFGLVDCSKTNSVEISVGENHEAEGCR